MSDCPKAQIGLPEVKLGIFPAWGGTTQAPAPHRPAGGARHHPQRQDARREARQADAASSTKSSSRAILLDSRPASSPTRGKRSGGRRTKFYIEGNPLARSVIFSKARKAVLAQTHGHYPAPLKAIEVMEYGMSAGVERGLAARSRRKPRSLVDAGDVAQNLVRLFFLMEESKKDPIAAKPRRRRVRRRPRRRHHGRRHRPDHRRQDRRRRAHARHQLEGASPAA